MLLVLCSYGPESMCQIDTQPVLYINTDMHSVSIVGIDIDNKEKLMLTASDGSTAKLWRVSTGKLLRTFYPPIGDVGFLNDAALSPNGKIAAVSGWTSEDGWDNSVFLLKTSNGEILQVLHGAKSVVLVLEFSPDGTHLVVGLANDDVLVYKKNKEGCFDFYKHLTGHVGKTDAIAFGPDLQLVTAGYDDYIRLYDPSFMLLQKQKLEGERPSSVAFSSDGEKIAVGYMRSDDIDILSSENLKVLYQANSGITEDNKGLGWVVSFSQCGKYLFASGKKEAGTKHVIRRWLGEGMGSFDDFPVSGNSVSGMKPLKNGDLLFAGSQPDFGRLSFAGDLTYYRSGEILDFTTKEVENREFNYLGVNVDGDRVSFFAYNVGHVMSFSIANMELEIPGKLEELYKDEWGRRLKVTDWHDHRFPKLNGKEIGIRDGEWSFSTDITSNGDRLVLGTGSNIRCYDSIGREMWRVGNKHALWAVNISGNDIVLVAARGDGMIGWYRMADGELLASLYVHPQTHEWIFFSPEGYFNCSNGARKIIGWRVKRRGDQTEKVYSHRRFWKRYYQPQIMKYVLTI